MELLLATPLCQALSCGRQWDFGEEVLFFFPHLKEFSVIQWNPLCRWNFWALGL